LKVFENTEELYKEAWTEMKRHGVVRFIRIVPSIAIPDYMAFLLTYCEPTGYTRKTVEAGHILKTDFHPPYVQLVCRDVERVVEEVEVEAREDVDRVLRGGRERWVEWCSTQVSS